MTERDRAARLANATRIVVASLIVGGGALALAGHAGADPAAPPGQPIVEPAGAPVGPPPPLPVGPPPVPEMSNPVYGQGQTSGPFGYLRDVWRAARSGDPVGVLTAPPENAPGPPPGAGPPPPLPPGFISLTAPESTTGPLPGAGSDAGPGPVGPPLPEGYFPLSGPPPPGWYDAPPPDPAAPPAIAPGAPAP